MAVKIFTNTLMGIIMLALGAGLFITTQNVSSSNTFEKELRNAHGQVIGNPQPGGYLFVEYDIPVVNHCDVMVSAFLINDEVEVSLDLLFIPKDHAIANYSLNEGHAFVWQIQPIVPPGTYNLEIHVKNDCSMFNSQSIKLKPIRGIRIGDLGDV